MMRRMAGLLAALAMAVPAHAQSQAPASVPACAVPEGLAGWSARPAAIDAAGGAMAMLAVGQRATLVLRPAEAVSFVAPPGKPVAAGDHAGLAQIDVAQAGTYRVALGAKAWIDLVQDGAVLASVAHAHGEPCTGIAKMVDFQLRAGRYILQLSAAADASLPVMIAKLP